MDSNPILDKVAEMKKSEASFQPVKISAQALGKLDELGACNWQCNVFRRISEPGREDADNAESFPLEGTPDEIRHMIEEAAKELGLNLPVEIRWGNDAPTAFSSCQAEHRANE